MILLKKIVLLALVIIFCSGDIKSQNEYSVDWGPEYQKTKGVFSTLKLIEMDDEYYYLLFDNRKSTSIGKFNHQHKLIATKKAPFNYSQHNSNLNKIIHTKNGTFGYLSSIKDKQWKLYVSRFDQGNFKKLRLIHSHPYRRELTVGLGWISTEGTVDNANELVISRDSNRVAFTNIIATGDRRNREESFDIAVFDADFKLLWKRIQKLPYQDKDLKITQTVISNEGTIYVLGKLRDRKKNSKGLPSYDFKIFQITETDVNEFDLRIGESIAPTDVRLYFPSASSSEILISGFYTDAQRKSGLKGVFFANGTKEEGVEHIEIHDFEKEFLEGMISDRQLKKDKGLENNYDFGSLLYFKDGSLGFIAENRYVTQYTSYQNGQSRTRYIYSSEDLVIVHFSKEGELLSLQKVPKYYSTPGGWDMVTYSLALYNDKVYLVFNDNKTYSERKELGTKSGSIYTDLAVIDENGQLEYHKNLFNNKDIELYYIPTISAFIDGKLLIGAMKALTPDYRMGIVNLE
ncbi:MAG: hypothetical protein AAFN10_21050 [Bacteroidota bacterium]